MAEFHNILIEGHVNACVRFGSVAQGLGIEIVSSHSAHQSDDCPVSTACSTPSISHPFRDDIDANLASAVVRKLFYRDSLTAIRFGAGQMAKVIVPGNDPTSEKGSPRAPADIRRHTQSIGAIIRPSLLPPPSNLDRLHQYQKDGIDWLVGRSAAILADDMGLGKTAQAITALRRLFSQSPIGCALIICPKQLMANWEKELATWAPELSWSRLTPPSRWRKVAWQQLFDRVHVLITNYEQTVLFRDLGPTYRFSTVILDEAHRVRNASANVTSYLREVNRDRTWALTGTPLEKSPADIWTILSIVEPRRFNLAQMPRNEESLKARARPYFLRRMKREFLPELPEEIEEHEIIELLPKQRAMYDMTLDRIQSLPGNELLAGLNELRSICDLHAASGQSAKLDRIVSILHDVAGNGEKAVVFSFLLGPLDVLGQMLAQHGMGYVQIRGEQSIGEREEALTRFDENPDISFLLASTRVGGEGLNLVGANHVVFFNRWWNPSANNQAKDRVSRMGQQRTVVVHSFTCRDTIEELLDQIIQDKIRLADKIVESLSDPVSDESILKELASRLPTVTPA